MPRLSAAGTRPHAVSWRVSCRARLGGGDRQIAITDGRRRVSGQSPRFRRALDQFAPYQPGPRVSGPGGRSVKLSSNESPFGPLPSVTEAIAEAVRGVNRYPDNGAADLIEAIAG